MKLTKVKTAICAECGGTMFAEESIVDTEQNGVHVQTATKFWQCGQCDRVVDETSDSGCNCRENCVC